MLPRNRQAECNLVLQNLSKKVRDCLQPAEESGQRARIERAPRLARDFLDMELHWLTLARSYQFGESRNLISAIGITLIFGGR